MIKRKEVKEQPKRAVCLLGGFTKASFLSEASALLNEVDGYISGWKHDQDTTAWKERVEAFLCHSLGDGCAQVSDFANVSYVPSFFTLGTDQSYFEEFYNEGLKTARRKLQGIKDEVEKYFKDDEFAVAAKSLNSRGVEASKDIFIVHGHDETLLLEVEKAVRALGLNPVVLRDQPNEGMTLIQKFEKNSSRACFAIFLLTDDEEATVRKNGQVENHARQNVVFEMGYFFNAFRSADGSHKGIFAILEKGVAKPGDVDGLVYHEYVKGSCDWKLSLAKELSAAGVRFCEANILKM